MLPLALPRFEVAARHRPVRLVVPDVSGVPLAGAVAPYVGTQARRIGAGRAELALIAGDTRMAARFDDDDVALRITAAGHRSTHRSRRHGRPTGVVAAVALTLTGAQVTAFTHENGAWVARSRFDLTGRADTPDVHDPAWLANLSAAATGPLDEVVTGRFGQLGLRDLRAVSWSDGTAYQPPGSSDAEVLLTATSAGPGGFPTAHTSVWALDRVDLSIQHRGDLFFRRPGRRPDRAGATAGRPGVYGDHAVHLVRDGNRWLVAASTWGDFEPRRRPVSIVLAEVDATDPTNDLIRGVHVLDARPLAMPTDGLRSVGTWDPHLMRDGDGPSAPWLVGFVTATRYFRFHPALAGGPTLDSLQLRAADGRRRECEGTTLLPGASGWRVLASDRRSKTYPVLDLELREVARLDAAYPGNIPWPTLVDLAPDDRDATHGPLLVGFDGQPYGGDLLGYGTHGRVVLQRGLSPNPSR